MADLVAADITFTFNNRDRKVAAGGLGFVSYGTIAFGDGAKTYPSAGVPIDIGKLGFKRRCRSLRVIESDAKGYKFEYDVSAKTLLMVQGGALTATGTNATSAVTVPVLTGVVKDDDCAASTGTNVFAAPQLFATSTTDINYGFFESTLASNADITFTVGNGGPDVTVNDNNSPTGLQIYFDEDGITEDRLLAVNASNSDIYIPCDDGTFIKIKDDDCAASKGVALECDDDGANTYERMLAIVPANANGSFTTALNSSVGTARTAAAQTFTGSSVAAAKFAELAGGSSAPAAQTLLIEAVGY